MTTRSSSSLAPLSWRMPTSPDSGDALLAGDADGQTIQGRTGVDQARIDIGQEDEHAVQVFSDGTVYSSLTVNDNGVNMHSPSTNNSLAVRDNYVQVFASDGYLHLFGGVTRIESAQTPPTNANDACTVGDFIPSTSFIYLCVATNTWKRVAIATW